MKQRIAEPWADHWVWNAERGEIEGDHVHMPGCTAKTEHDDCGEIGPRTVLETDGGYYVEDNDARLMAAAPDLYRALDEIVDRPGEATPVWVARAVAALRKARGE